MKTKSAKQPKRTKPAVQLKDLNPRKDAKGGVDGNTIYVATAGGGAWKTRDGGLSW